MEKVTRVVQKLSDKAISLMKMPPENVLIKDAIFFDSQSVVIDMLYTINEINYLARNPRPSDWDGVLIYTANTSNNIGDELPGINWSNDAESYFKQINNYIFSNMDVNYIIINFELKRKF